MLTTMENAMVLIQKSLQELIYKRNVALLWKSKNIVIQFWIPSWAVSARATNPVLTLMVKFQLVMTLTQTTI